jgi:hypothetical protein
MNNKVINEGSNSPPTFKSGGRGGKQNSNFLNDISNALAANPMSGMSNDMRNKPSFTIQRPSNCDQRKESWFGSFGMGRKSTENVFGGLDTSRFKQ